jgi:hypothetical protein
LIVNLIFAKRASKLIVIYSRLPLHFSNEYGIFCEGELRQNVDTNDDGIVAQQLTPIFDNNSNAAISQQLVGLSQTGLVCLVGCIDLVNHIGLFGHIGLVGRIGHNSPISFIGLGFVGFIGLSLVSFVGIISHISLVGRGGFSYINNFIGLGLVGFIGLNLGSLINSISLMGLDGLIGFIRLVDRISFGLNGLIGKGIIINSLQFEIEIYKSQHDLFWREIWLWCVMRVFSSLAGLNSVLGNALQNATQLFFDRIPQMT